MYSNMSLNNLNFGDNMNLQNISNRNTHDQVYLNAPYNKYKLPYNYITISFKNDRCYMIDSCSLFNELTITPTKLCNDVKCYGSCTDQTTTCSRNQLTYNSKEIESFLMQNFCFCIKLNNECRNQRYLVENNDDCCEELKEASCEYDKNRFTHFKDIQTYPIKSIESETINDKENNQLISNTVEEVLQTQAFCNDVSSTSNYGKSKRKLYHLRQDVIVKIIFRCMRKYFIKDFKAFFDFSKCRSNNNSDKNGVLYRQINRYLDAKFGDKKLENMAIYFTSIIDIKEKFISMSNQHKDLKETISGLLYCYNKIKLSNLIKIPQFALLMFSFLNKSNILKLVIKSQDSSEVIQTYSEVIQTLKCQCSMSLRA